MATQDAAADHHAAKDRTRTKPTRIKPFAVRDGRLRYSGYDGAQLVITGLGR